MTKLTHRARTLLWAGSGGFLGLAGGVALVDASFLPVFLVPWALAFGVYAGSVLLFGREKAPKPTVVPVQGQPAAPRAPQPIHVRVGFPDVPEGYPPVLGVEEPLHVHVTVDWKEGAAEGAAVRLTGRLRDGAKFLAGEGVAGEDGAVTFSVKPPGVGEVILDAEAVLGDLRGAGSASLSLVRYEEEIERLFSEFRAYAQDALGPESKADTARELADKLRSSSSPDAARALLELARVYELVVYGDRAADRQLYLALVGALLQLEREA